MNQIDQDSQGHVPNFAAMQGMLLDVILKASESCGVVPTIHQYGDSTRLGLRVTTQQDAYNLVAACRGMPLTISEPQTQTSLTLENIQTNTHSHLRLWCPIIIAGRMIHGPLSGIDLFIREATCSAGSVAFPHPLFQDSWLNDHLAGHKLDVEDTVLVQLENTARPRRVDIVFTWVNDQDPVWLKKRAQYQPVNATKDGADAARFANHDELLFALRGILRYFDGIGRIYLVTDCQIPIFFDEFSDRVTLIDHDQIMGPDVTRPTFNSHVIESCLHRIPGLAPAYVYFNDDVIITNPISVCDLFDETGRAKIFYSEKTFIPSGSKQPNMRAADTAAINARDLFQTRYQVKISRKFKHAPIALHRDVMAQLEVKFHNEFIMLRKNRFRHPTDIAPSGSLYQNYALFTKHAVAADITYQYMQVSSWNLSLRLLWLSVMPASVRPTVLCLNAVTGGGGSKLNRHAIAWYMQRLFPALNQPVQQNTRRDILHFRVFACLAKIISLKRRLKFSR